MAETDRREEVEVTPAMIEAGVAVFCRMESAYAGEAYWVEQIYRAMAVARSDTCSSPLPPPA